MGNNKVLSVLITVLISVGLSAVSCFFIVKKKQSEQLAWVDIGKLLDGFELNKQLTAQLKNTINARIKILDSLELNLKILASQIKTGKEQDLVSRFNAGREEYLLKKQKFEQENQIMDKDYNEQVFKQINQYTKEYGIAHSYQFIYGTSGNGSLMFANDAQNITDDLLIYINKKYQGGK